MEDNIDLSKYMLVDLLRSVCMCKWIQNNQIYLHFLKMALVTIVIASLSFKFK